MGQVKAPVYLSVNFNVEVLICLYCLWILKWRWFFITFAFWSVRLLISNGLYRLGSFIRLSISSFLPWTINLDNVLSEKGERVITHTWLKKDTRHILLCLLHIKPIQNCIVPSAWGISNSENTPATETLNLPDHLHIDEVQWKKRLNDISETQYGNCNRFWGCILTA